MEDKRGCFEGIKNDISEKEMNKKTIFQKIIDKELPADILYEDDEIICIKDKYPLAPIHLLLIAKKCIESAYEIEDCDFQLLGKIFKKAQDIAREIGVEDNYRLVTNVGSGAGQSICHLHFHFLSNAHNKKVPQMKE